MAVTRRQREVLDTIQDFIKQNQYSPSLEEIGGALGLSSVATVHKHVSHLVDKGYLRRAWNQNRSIELAERPEDMGMVELPLMGTIAAGCPVEAIVTSEVHRVPEEMVQEAQGTYLLRVQGESMIDEQIRDGDLVIVEERQVASDGETVVALIDDSEATLKQFFREKDMIRLQPANEAMDPIIVASNRVRIQGVVVGLMRKY
jgi:repressor LexA